MLLGLGNALMHHSGSITGTPAARGHSFGTISILVQRVRAGDPRAREQLAGRCIEALRGFASRRVPYSVRGRLDSDDLVQNAVMRAFERIDAFERRGHGSFLANLRTIVLNQVRDEARRIASRAPHDEPDETLPDLGPTPLDAAIGSDVVASYEEALNALRPRQREAIILRLEMGYSYEEVAEALGLVSASAARMLVARTLVRLAVAMERHATPRAE